MDYNNNETGAYYTPAQPEFSQPAPRKKKSNALPVLGIVLGVLLFFFGLFALLGAMQQHDTADLADTPYADIDLQTRYYANVMVVDSIGTMTEGEKELEDYYLGVFKDGISVLRYCVIRVEQDSPLYRKMRDYAEDDEALIGDLWIEGYYKVSSILSTDGLKDAYNDGLEVYDPILAEKYTDIEVGEYTLEWIAGTDAEYLAAEKKLNASAIFGGVLFAVLGAAIVILCAARYAKNNKNNQQQNAPSPVDFPAPPQPQENPYAQPQVPYEEPEVPYEEPQTPDGEPTLSPPADTDGADGNAPF